MINEHITFELAYPFAEHGRNWTQMADSRDTLSDWHLVPLTRIIANPPVFKENYISSQAQMGENDISDANGLMYENRRGRWTFKFVPQYDHLTLINDIVNYLHGNQMKVYINGDTNYYLGRITVEEVRSAESGEYVTLGYNLEPYWYDTSTYIYEHEAQVNSTTTTATYHLPITRKPSVPYLEVYLENAAYPTLTIKYQRINNGYFFRRTTSSPWEEKPYYYPPDDGTLMNVTETIDLSPYAPPSGSAQIYFPVDTSGIVIYTEENGTGKYDFHKKASTFPDSTHEVTLTLKVNSGKMMYTLKYIGGWL